MPQNLSNEELLQAYLDLQARVTQFSSKEQELINMRDTLDQELEVYKRMNDFHAEALEVHDVPKLLELIAEYVVDLFECEMGYARVSDVKSNTLVADHLEGGQRANAAANLAALRSFRADVFIKHEAFSWHRMVEKQQASTTLTLSVAAAVSKDREGTYLGFTPKKATLFRLFVDSCAPYIENIQSNERIQHQLETIRKSELEQRRLSLIATTTHSGVIITDNHGQIQWINDAFTENTGYRLDEVIGLKPKNFLQGPGLNDAETLRKLSSALLAKENVSVDLKNLRKNGDPFFIRLNVTPVFDRDHNLINFIGIQQDITDRKVHEEQLETQNAELTKINQELDQFVYSISHDLRAPLLSIQGLLDLIDLEASESGNDVYLNMIAESVNRLDNTILEILNYSRNARLDIHPEEIQLKPLVEALVKDLSNVRPEVKVSIEWEGSEVAVLDEVRVGVLLKNVVSNALKYSKRGVEDAFVLIQGVVEPNLVTLRVRDNGEGIGEEHLQKVFDMFYRASRNGSGTGLGLYICKEIVDKLGGTLSLQSKLGEGTVVEFTIPQ